MMPRDPITRDAAKVLALPPIRARRELGRIFAAADKLDKGSVAHQMALDHNAHLVTAIRESCELTKRRCPWLVQL